MLAKLNEACALYHSRQKRPMSLHEAINYINSDLVSKLQYRMYLVKFPQESLGSKFQSALTKAVKRLAGLASSTATDLLVDQGLHYVYTL